MSFPNIFTKTVSDQIIQRIQQLTPQSKALWGKMSIDQMLAHVNVAYEMAFENKHPKATGLKRWLLKTFVKKGVVGPSPYKKSTPTAPAFIINENRDFEQEKSRLIAYIEKCVSLGEKYFDQKESLSFGPMSIEEWNTLFYKHIDHHLSQFGV